MEKLTGNERLGEFLRSRGKRQEKLALDAAGDEAAMATASIEPGDQMRLQQSVATSITRCSKVEGLRMNEWTL